MSTCPSCGAIAIGVVPNCGHGSQEEICANHGIQQPCGGRCFPERPSYGKNLADGQEADELYSTERLFAAYVLGIPVTDVGTSDIEAANYQADFQDFVAKDLGGFVRRLIDTHTASKVLEGRLDEMRLLHNDGYGYSWFTAHDDVWDGRVEFIDRSDIEERIAELESLKDKQDAQ